MNDKQQPAPELKPCPFCGERLILLGDYTQETAWNWYGHSVDSECLLSDLKIQTGLDMQTPTTNDTKAWNTRADLLQRVPDEGLAEIRERWADVPTMGVGIWEHGDSLYEEAEPHRTVGHLHGQIKRDTAIALSRSKSDIDYLLSLLQQPPAASERCGECGHERFLNEEICTFIPEPSTGVICGHRCIPATGATTEHET